MDALPPDAPSPSRPHHRWAAILGLVLFANAAVLTLGWKAPVAVLMGMSAGLSSLLLALGGVSISIIFPPAANTREGMFREYTLLVSFEGLSFVVVYGVVSFLYPSLLSGVIPRGETVGQGWAAAMVALFLLAWMALQLRLLLVAAQEAVGDEIDSLKVVIGTLLGMLAWLAFVAVTFRTFGIPAVSGAERPLLDFRLLVVLLGTVPAAAGLAFVLTTTFCAAPPSLTTWARASTGYLTALPLLVILTFSAMALGI